MKKSLEPHNFALASLVSQVSDVAHGSLVLCLTDLYLVRVCYRGTDWLQCVTITFNQIWNWYIYLIPIYDKSGKVNQRLMKLTTSIVYSYTCTYYRLSSDFLLKIRTIFREKLSKKGPFLELFRAFQTKIRTKFAY